MGQYNKSRDSIRTTDETESLKALADKVLQRDTCGTKGGTDSHILSQALGTENETSGTPMFPLTSDTLEQYQERAAIMEFDAGMSRKDAEKAAFEDCKVICMSKFQLKGNQNDR